MIPWKILGWLVGAFVFLGLILAAWVAFGAYSAMIEARHFWEETERNLLAKGESLSVEDYIPPAIPEERNFFADPLWEDLSDRVEVDWAGTIAMRNQVPLEERRTYDLTRPFSEGERADLEEAFPEFAPLEESKDAGLVAYELWKREGSADGDRKRRAAEFLRVATAQVNPVLSRIEDLLERPEARFSISYHDGPAMELEHIGPLLGAVRWLRLRGSAAMEMGEPRNAARDAIRILRLAETVQNEPVQFSVLVGASMNLQGVEFINEGILQHAWAEDSLRDFKKALAAIDLIPALAKALRFERAAANTYIETLLRHADNDDLQQALGWREASIRFSPTWYWLYRHLGFPEDKAYYSRSIESWVDVLDAVDHQGLQSQRLFSFASEAKAMARDRKGRLFSFFLLGDLELGMLRVIWIQNQIDLTRIACALELSLLEQGEYPAVLTDLVPQYFDTLPMDLTSLLAPRYEKMATDRFRLWSLGWNGSDEGGVAEKKREEGDWVWGG